MKQFSVSSFSSYIISLLVMGTIGCAKHEAPPLELLGAAKMAVHDAEQNDHTAQLAPVDLLSAQQKVIAADRAITRNENREARRFSEQAIVDAQLAKAKTLTAQSTLGAREEHDALRDVQRQILRNH